ncbi:MAG: chloride channel protein [Pararhizobium sp.]
MVVAGIVGVLAGLSVVALHGAANLMHQVLFGLKAGEGLSGVESITPFPDALVPMVGGAILGLLMLLTRRRKGRPVDPVEANALHGGRLSLTDSVIIGVQTLVSNGFGASVGLEAAYTQLGSGMASKLGSLFRLRRADMRMLVGCGAAGAIGAAFNAPLTGAFYGFELIIGTYTIASLAPVICSSIAAVLVARALTGGHSGFFIHMTGSLGVTQVSSLMLLGLITGGMGILIMFLVTRVGDVFNRIRVPVYVRPALGGLLLGAMAIVTPKVLSSGHSAVQEIFSLGLLDVRTAVLILVLKILASAISIGSGFRGGLFFASLLLGALTGQLFQGLMMLISPSLMPIAAVTTLVGMTGLAASVVGGPLTMSFLALEASGSLPLTIAVLVAAVASSLLTRETFGYSFTTWRFHLRGEAIRSAHDIGWMRNLTVGRMMRKDIRTVSADMTLKEFRRLYPLGSTQRVIATEDDGQYAGIIVVPELYSTINGEEEGTIRPLLTHRNTVLTPAMRAKQAAVMFEQSESEALAVVVDQDNWSVLGLLSEAYVLRRYAEELDKARMELAGERA